MSSKTMCFTVKNKHEIVREPIMIAGQGLRQALGLGPTHTTMPNPNPTDPIYHRSNHGVDHFLRIGNLTQTRGRDDRMLHFHRLHQGYVLPRHIRLV